ncbi:MAG: hypothetical protein PVI92_04715 [Chromatiales bacterium]|jgi:hypothetical protein
MRPKLIGPVLALLGLTGCAIGPTPHIKEQAQEQAQEQAHEQAQEQRQVEEQVQARLQALLQLQEQERQLTASRMLDALERVATLNAGDTKQMVEQLQAGANDLTAGERFELLLLLSKQGTDNRSLKQASQLLKALETKANEPSVREVLRLQRHNLHLEKLYRRERKKSAELQNKIEYLKGLERQLDESNTRVEEPSNPKPELAQ